LTNHKKAMCQQSFLPFVREMWSAFIGGHHHTIMADAFERVANGDLKRLIVNMPPRHTKSEFASYLFPAWYLGMYPEKKIIQTAHTAELAVGFGRKVRNLVGSPDYQSIFNTKLSSDSKAAGRWNTNKGGDYFAIGVGGAVTGKGADVLIIDDPHSEQEAMQGSPAVYDKVYEWYSSGPRQRLQPGGSIVLVMTRWSKRDLTGQILHNSIVKETDEWEVIELPALMPSGNPLWQEFWKLEAFKDRMEFPRLKQTAYEFYEQWQPDTLLVEKKAAGAPLIYELRKTGIPISEYTPSKGSDKIARINAVSDLFHSGLVWCPEKRWAEEVMEEVASFPNGDHDDLVDSTSQALLRFRQGGFIRIPTDQADNEFYQRRAKYY
jgi:predicted phage terminase large subunit-like protein